MIKPVDIPVNYFTRSSEDSNIKCETSDDEYATHDTKTKHSETCSQKELNDLIRNLGFPNDDGENLVSASKERRKFSKRKKIKCLLK